MILQAFERACPKFAANHATKKTTGSSSQVDNSNGISIAGYSQTFWLLASTSLIPHTFYNLVQVSSVFMGSIKLYMNCNK